jgi:hypothetical protein
MLDEHRIFGCSGQQLSGLALCGACLLRAFAAMRLAVLCGLGIVSISFSAKGFETIIACSFGDREELFDAENELGLKQSGIQLSILNEFCAHIVCAGL